jgi:hypothetical protein
MNRSQGYVYYSNTHPNDCPLDDSDDSNDVPSLDCCDCDAAKIRAEIKLLQDTSREALKQSNEQLEELKKDISQSLSEISYLEAAIKKARRAEKEALERIALIEQMSSTTKNNERIKANLLRRLSFNATTAAIAAAAAAAATDSERSFNTAATSSTTTCSSTNSNSNVGAGATSTTRSMAAAAGKVAESERKSTMSTHHSLRLASRDLVTHAMEESLIQNMKRIQKLQQGQQKSDAASNQEKHQQQNEYTTTTKSSTTARLDSINTNTETVTEEVDVSDDSFDGR